MCVCVSAVYLHTFCVVYAKYFYTLPFKLFFFTFQLETFCCCYYFSAKIYSTQAKDKTRICVDSPKSQTHISAAPSKTSMLIMFRKHACQNTSIPLTLVDDSRLVRCLFLIHSHKNIHTIQCRQHCIDTIFNAWIIKISNTLLFGFLERSYFSLHTHLQKAAKRSG